MLHHIGKFFRATIILWAMGFVAPAFAAASPVVYANPSSIAGCSLISGTTYSCASIALSTDTYFSGSTLYTLNLSGTLTLSNNVTFGTSTNKVNVVATGSITLNNNAVVYGDLTSSQTITLGNSSNTDVYGNITANLIDMGNNAFVHGNCSSNSCSGSCNNNLPASSNCTTTSSNKLSQTITFNTQTTTTRTFVSGSTFGLSPVAAASSGLAVSYSSTTTSVCTISGTTVTMVAAGTCTIAADQAGNSNYSAATQVTQSITLAAANPTSFSAYESNITNTNAATAANRVIMTRVASTSGNLCPNGLSTTAVNSPTAVKTCSLTIAGFISGSVASSYSGSLSVKLQYCSTLSRSGTGTSTTFTCTAWTDLSAAQTVALTSGVGIATFTFVNNAYEVVRVYINSSALGITSYSDDYFAIRPTGLTVTATDATVATAGSTRSLTSGANTHKAGQPFTLNAQAYVTSSGTTASNYRGTGAGPISQTVNTTSPTGTGLVNGTLLPGIWSGSGTVTSTTATYSEVGTFTLTLEDQDFANVDVNDGSSTAERYFSGNASLGRFTPDHFITVVTQSCSTFTYSGQPFTTTIAAYNGLSTPTVTKNYNLAGNTVTLSDAGTTTYMTVAADRKLTV